MTPPPHHGNDRAVLELLVEVALAGVVRRAVRAGHADVERRLQEREPHGLRAPVERDDHALRPVDHAFPFARGAQPPDLKVLEEDILRTPVGVRPAPVAVPHLARAVAREPRPLLEVGRRVEHAADLQPDDHEADADVRIDLVRRVGRYLHEVCQRLPVEVAPRLADRLAAGDGRVGEDGLDQRVAVVRCAAGGVELPDAVAAEAGVVRRRVERHAEIVVPPDDLRVERRIAREEVRHVRLEGV